MTAREILARLRDRLRRGRLDDELAEELRFHRDQLVRDARAAGADDDSAHHVASRALGNETVAREDARARWTLPPLEALARDLRHAIRGLRRSPAFTLTVVATLSLGIGANVAMFSAIDRLMYRPLAYLRDPGSVHRLYWEATWRGRPYAGPSTEYTRYLDVQRWTTSFSQFAAFHERDLAVGEGESARELRIGAVSASYFSFFDAPPALGRYFVAEEDVTPKGAEVAVLSHTYWQSAFGGRDVVGERLAVGDMRVTIVGVAPRGFAGVDDTQPPAVFVPITTYAYHHGGSSRETYFTEYQWGWVHAIARRKPGVSREAAEEDATRAAVLSWRAHREQVPAMQPLVEARPRLHVAAVRRGAGPDPGLESRTATWVGVVAVVVLLIACANVANLFLARALRRRREAAVRLALGVSRARLLRESMTESVVVAMLGGAGALLVAQWGGSAINALLLGEGQGEAPFTDLRTLGVAFALALATGLLIGIVPPLVSSRGDLAGSLRGGARGGARDGRRIRSSLLVAQAALSVALLVGAALFVRSLGAVKDKRLGYDTAQVAMAWRTVRGVQLDDSASVALRRLLLETAESHPDVEAAAWITTAPFVSNSTTSLHVAGIDSVGRLGSFDYQQTTPGYFRAMGTRILRGRAFGAEDRFGAPRVAVVSESMARVLWPGREALGECFRMGRADAPCITVIGVAEDMVQRDVAQSARLNYYVPVEQTRGRFGLGLVLRVRGEPAAKAEGLRVALQRVMPGDSYVRVQPFSEILADVHRSWRLGATMFGAFGLLALVVAAVGLHGVISYNVTERTHELGVRVALGAQRGDVLRLVVGESVRFTLAGVGLGLLVAAVSGRWLQPLLFEQSARDPAVYAAVGAATVLVALAASAVPALRASRSDPAMALRAE